MKKSAFAVFFLFILCAAVFAASYEDNIAMGNMAYENWDLKDALKYYNAAYAERPGLRLLERINLIKKEVGDIAAIIPPKDENPGKWVLVGADILGIAVSIYAYADYNNALSNYNDLREKYDLGQATYEEYTGSSMALLSSRLFMSITVPVTLCVILYTLADLSVIHWFFPAETSTALVPYRDGLMFSYNTAF